MRPSTNPRRCGGKHGGAEAGWIAATAVGGLVLLAGAVFFYKGPVSTVATGPKPAPLAVGKPIHVATFDDGSELQILNIGDGTIEEGDLHAKHKGSWISGYSSGSSTACMSGDGVEAQVSHFTFNEQLAGLRFQSLPANLLLESRMLGPSGAPIKSTRILWQDRVRVHGRDDGDFPGWEAVLKAAEYDGTLPEIVVQLSDGAGGWINGCGPFNRDGDVHQRGMIAFPAWPRTHAELEFRAVRPGMKPQTWKLANPSRSLAPKPWSASPLPQTHSATDFELELVTAARIGNSRLIQPRFRFLSKVPGDTLRPGGGSNGFTMLDCTCRELLGACGTRSVNSYLRLPHDHVASGFPYPPDERVLRFRFVIRPTDVYPYPRPQALLVARAKVAADGKSLESPPAILTSHGILSVEFSDITTGAEGGFQYTVKAHWNNEAEKTAGEAALGAPDRIPVCFTGESPVAVGSSETKGSGRSSHGFQTEFDHSVRWRGPLRAGDEVTVGMTTAIPDREVDFTFEP